MLLLASLFSFLSMLACLCSSHKGQQKKAEFKIGENETRAHSTFFLPLCLMSNKKEITQHIFTGTGLSGKKGLLSCTDQ